MTEYQRRERIWIAPRHPGGGTAPGLYVFDYQTRARVMLRMHDVYRLMDAAQDLIDEYEERNREQ
ncbi:hypothetical protein [Nocardia puris]|nr:hypothetical protein [Nocardia puris]